MREEPQVLEEIAYLSPAGGYFVYGFAVEQYRTVVVYQSGDDVEQSSFPAPVGTK
jgi:hypothetical protein